MRRIAVAAVLLAGCAPAAAEARIGKVASDPHAKTVQVETSSTVEHRTTTEPVVETTTTVRDLLAECEATVSRLLPLYPPPATWADPVCHEPDRQVEAEFGRPLEGYALWQPRTIHLTPQSGRMDMEYLYLHELGHAHCFMTPWPARSWESDVYRYSEQCADAWASERAS